MSITARVYITAGNEADRAPSADLWDTSDQPRHPVYGPHEGNLNDPMRVFQLADCVVA
jgi:hypothetical protein